MTVAEAKKSMTLDEFMALPDAREYELVDGQLVGRKTMGAEAT